MTALEDCCYIAECCGRPTCRDETPSPGETERVCADCYREDAAQAQIARVRALMVTHQAKDGRVPVCQLRTALDGAR